MAHVQIESIVFLTVTSLLFLLTSVIFVRSCRRILSKVKTNPADVSTRESKRPKAVINARRKRRLTLYKCLTTLLFLTTLAYNIYTMTLAAIDLADFLESQGGGYTYGYILIINAQEFAVQFKFSSVNEILVLAGDWSDTCASYLSSSPCNSLTPLVDGTYPTGDYGSVDRAINLLTYTRKDSSPSLAFAPQNFVSQASNIIFNASLIFFHL